MKYMMLNLTIKPRNECREGYSDEILNRLNELSGKKIIEINGMVPYEYLDEIAKKGFAIHSPQARYIYLQFVISDILIQFCPLLKEELKVSIKFENIDELFNIEYKFVHIKLNLDSEFQQFFEAEHEKCLKYRIPFPTYEEIELKYKIKKGIFKNNLNNNEEDIWDLKSKDKHIKCKVDKNNKLNVLYQNSFSSKYYDNYEKTHV